jgi:hypothetical protein
MYEASEGGEECACKYLGTRAGDDLDHAEDVGVDPLKQALPSEILEEFNVPPRSPEGIPARLQYITHVIKLG